MPHSISPPSDLSEFDAELKRNLLLALNEVHVWVVSLNPSAQVVEYLYGLLSGDEQHRAQDFRFKMDRRRFIVARGYLRTLLGCYLDSDPDQITFRRGEFGKLHLSGPYGSRALNFNVSHSGEHALYGFTRIGELGVDLEVIKPRFETSEVENIARRFFSPAEVDSLNQLDVADRNRAFFRYWVCKEAFIKAKGEGLSCPLDAFDVSPAIRSSPAVARIAFGTNDDQDWGVRELEIDDGYAAAVSLRAVEWVIRMWRVDETGKIHDQRA